jgi:hypothetical protein
MQGNFSALKKGRLHYIAQRKWKNNYRNQRIQQLVCEESNLHFDYCRRQSQGVGDGRTFKKYGDTLLMTVYGVHDKGIWNTKNFISAELIENSK